MGQKIKHDDEPKRSRLMVQPGTIIVFESLNHDIALYRHAASYELEPVHWPGGESKRHVRFIDSVNEFADFALLIGQTNGLAIKDAMAVHGNRAYEFYTPEKHSPVRPSHHTLLSRGPLAGVDDEEED